MKAQMEVGFAPDAARAEGIYGTTIARLAESVRDIIQGCPREARIPGRITNLPERIAAVARPSPDLCCRYFDLLALTLADDVPGVLELLDEMDRTLKAAPGEPFFVSWADLPPETAALYLRHINNDPATPVRFDAPSAATFSNARTIGETALERLRQADPELAGEVRALLNDVVFVVGTAGEGILFDGATSFFCWGTLFLNAEEHASVIAMVDGIAHESAHALLFGLSQGEPFVLNPAGELRPSPLRLDPRPLDGIYHAVFVSARIAYALDRLEAAGALLESERAEAETARHGAVRAFYDGYQTLEAYAEMTALGQALMANASLYMERHRDLVHSPRVLNPRLISPRPQ